MHAGRHGCAWGQEVKAEQCRVLHPSTPSPSLQPHPSLLLASGTGTLRVYGAEVLLELLLLQLQVPRRHQGRAKALREERGGEGRSTTRSSPFPAPPQPWPINRPTPTTHCPRPHRCPRGENAVEHVASKSHADHQISGIAGGGAMGGGGEQRISQALVIQPDPLPDPQTPPSLGPSQQSPLRGPCP